MPRKVFSDYQQMAIDGLLPDNKVTATMCEKIIERAVRAGLTDIAERFEALFHEKLKDPIEIQRARGRQWYQNRRERGQEYGREYMRKHRKKRTDTYTERQKKIINGEIPIQDLRMQELGRLFKRLEKENDTETMTRLLPLKEQVLADQKERNRQAREVRAKKAEERNQPTFHRVLDASVYKQRDIDIIRGVIPYDTVHGIELLRIRSVAVKANDTDVVGLIDNLLNEKQLDRIIGGTRESREEEATAKRWLKGFYPKNIKYRATPKTEVLIADDYDLLESRTDADYSVEYAERLARLCQKPEYDKYRKTAEFLLQVAKCPSCIYTVKTRGEAIRVIVEYTFQYIRLPENWDSSDEEESDEEERPP